MNFMQEHVLKTKDKLTIQNKSNVYLSCSSILCVDETMHKVATNIQYKHFVFNNIEY